MLWVKFICSCYTDQNQSINFTHFYVCVGFSCGVALTDHVLSKIHSGHTVLLGINS